MKDVEKPNSTVKSINLKPELVSTIGAVLENWSPVALDFLDHIPFAVFLFDKSGAVKKCNQKALDLFGFSENDLESMTILRIIGSEFHGKYDIINVLDSERCFIFETTTHRKNEQPFNAGITACLVPAGDEESVCLFVKDITARKKLQQEILDSEHKYHLLVDNMNAGMAIVLGDFIVFANRKFQEMIGHSELKILATLFIEFVDAAYREMILSRCTGSRNGSGLPDICEIQMITSDSRLMDVEIITSGIQYDGQNATQMIVRDITEKKKIEEQLNHVTQMAYFGPIAAGIAHEINNPLGALSIDLQRLIASSRTKQKKEHYMRMLGTVNRVAKLAEDLLHVGKKKHYSVTSHDIKNHIENVLNIMNGSFASGNKTFKLNIPKELPKIQGNGTQMDQVFMNVIKNALEAMTSGGLLEISIHHLEEVDRIEMVFSDDGPGIPHKMIKHVFEPFFTTKKAGSGLGLALCRGIIENLHGSFDIRNREPHGLTVSIQLPIVSGPSEIR